MVRALKASRGTAHLRRRLLDRQFPLHQACMPLLREELYQTSYNLILFLFCLRSLLDLKNSKEFSIEICSS